MSDRRIKLLLNKKYKNNYSDLKDKIDLDQYCAEPKPTVSFFRKPLFYGLTLAAVAAISVAIIIPVSLQSPKAVQTTGAPAEVKTDDEKGTKENDLFEEMDSLEEGMNPKDEADNASEDSDSTSEEDTSIESSSD